MVHILLNTLHLQKFLDVDLFAKTTYCFTTVDIQNVDIITGIIVFQFFLPFTSLKKNL